ncbi:hypothetical protein VTN02DRAFT_2810 [Thermoascus thermophilus]
MASEEIVPLDRIEVDQTSGTTDSYFDINKDDDDDMSVYTASLTNSVRDYKWLHGRRFHSYHSGSEFCFDLSEIRVRHR